ncbi:MAG: BatD family protein, partial [Candidatus Symbiothrix sp.]|nr:BatD family protein [Candidatus Symbiothrix sp.]
ATRENNASVSNADIFVRMNVAKSSVYENEGFLVTFKLYTAIDFSNFENIKYPEFEGFIAQEVELPENRQWNLENHQGRNYRTIVMKQSILYPQRSGKISIGQGKYDVVIRQRVESQRRSIFDMFDTYANVKKTITSSSVTIDVKALPSGKPASFSGAVGEYKLNSTISSTQIKAGDPVTIKLNLSGSGNIKLVNHPAIVFPNDFELFDPKIDVSTKVTTSGVSGTKTIEYYAVPNYAGDFTIPSAEFSYFDAKSGTYKTLKTNEYNLHVTPGEGGSSKPATIVGGVNKEDIRLLGEDIRHIKTSGFQFHPNGHFFGSLAYWLWYLIPVVIFVAFFILYRKQIAENANVALARTKKANKVASKRLKKAAQHLKAGESESFYDETLKAVWGYLSDKLMIPTANLTKDNVEAELQRYGVGKPLIREFMDVLNSAEFARFAPNQGSGAMDELYQKTVDTINSMEKI